MKRFSAFICVVLVAAAAVRAADDPYLVLAERLSAPAGKKLKTVAVLPFGCAESSGTCRDGRVLGERLTTELINLGKFTVIDPGQYAGALEEFAFKPEAGASPELVRSLRKKYGADALITGMSVDLGDGRSELTARLVRTADAAAVLGVRVLVPRDWAAAAEPRDLRASLRALAMRRVRAASTPEWAEFGRMKAASLATRLSITNLGGKEKLADFEIDAWKAYPAEAASRVYFFCAATNCEALGVTGEGYFKAYFPDGFVLQLDEAGDVLDCYYPERSFARLKMRLLAKRRSGENVAAAPEWAKFLEVMDYKYVPVPEKRDPDSLRSEIDRWKAAADEKVTGIFTPQTNERADFYKVTFPDGFTLVFDGPSGAIERCEYEKPETAG